jgi:hypothetical protein
MRRVSVTRFIILALAIFTLGGCVSDPNHLNKRTAEILLTGGIEVSHVAQWKDL